MDTRAQGLRRRSAPLLASLLLGPALAHAAVPPSPPVQEAAEPEPSGGMVDAAHAAVSETVEAWSLQLDRFFAGERIYQEATGTYARLGASLLWDEGGALDTAAQLRIKLDLPNTEQRLKFLLEGDPDDIGGLEEPDDRLDPLRMAQNTTYAAAVRNIITRSEHWDLSTDTGIKLRSPLDPFVRIRSRRSFLLDRWVLRTTTTAFWFDSDGPGAGTRIELERPWVGPLFFRATGEGVWYDEDDTFDLRQSLQVFHWLSHRRGVIYEATVFGESRPTVHATAYLLDLRYRQLVYRDWLYFELSPQLRFERERGFAAEHALAFTVEISFGRPYL